MSSPTLPVTDTAANTVVVLSEPADTTADLVVRELHERNTPVFRLDMADFPLSLSLSAYFDGTWQGVLRTTHRAVELAAIRSIYVRRPTGFIFPPAMTDAEQRFAAREARRGLGGLFMGLPCFWVNHPARIADAEYKPLQYQAAAACGLHVPRTVLSNSPQEAARYGDYLGPHAVYKTLASASVVNGEAVNTIYTTEVTTADMADTRVALTAHQFQTKVPKVRDVRATVVGNQIFAVNIVADKACRGRLDWRADYAALQYEPCQLPPAVETALLSLLCHFGLTFAAADFVVTSDDQYYFIDLNPAGQWGWIVDATGLPIAAALADLLMKGTL